MELFFDFFAIVIILLMVGNMIYFFGSLMLSGLSPTIEDLQVNFRNRIPPGPREKYEPILLKNFSYYRKLSEKSKIRFMLRLKKFIDSKKFTGRNDLQVTDEMKALISASAVQLTFGLNNYLMEHFSEIFIFPDIFLSRGTDQYHKGETNIRGAIVFSWKDFYEGYAVENDKFNLGLHEMAHALELSRRLDEFDYYFAQYFSKWSAVALYEYQNINNDRASFLRKYAGANIHEFFAVCVEHFFEAPAEFNEKLPDIYRHLCVLLKQNPIVSYEKNMELAELKTNRIPASEYLDGAKFITHFSIRSISWQFVNFFLISLYIYFQSAELLHFNIIFLMLSFFTIIFIIQGAFLFTRFEVFENHLIIRKPIFFNTMKCIAFESMAKATFTNERYDCVNILYVDKHEIKTYTQYFSINKDDLQKLMQLLKERKIPVRGDL